MCKINCSGGCPDCAPEEHTFVHVLMKMDYGGEFVVAGLFTDEAMAERLALNLVGGRVDTYPLDVLNSRMLR